MVNNVVIVDHSQGGSNHFWGKLFIRELTSRVLTGDFGIQSFQVPSPGLPEDTLGHDLLETIRKELPKPGAKLVACHASGRLALHGIHEQVPGDVS